MHTHLSYKNGALPTELRELYYMYIYVVFIYVSNKINFFSGGLIREDRFQTRSIFFLEDAGCCEKVGFRIFYIYAGISYTNSVLQFYIFDEGLRPLVYI